MSSFYLKSPKSSFVYQQFLLIFCTFPGKSPSAASSLKRLPIYTSRTVAGTIKKFDPSQENKSTNTNQTTNNNTNNNSHQMSCNNNSTNTKASTKCLNNENTKKSNKHISRVDKIVEKLSNKETVGNHDGNLTVSPPTVRYRSPSPSLLRKTQAVIAKEQCNEYYMAKQALKSPVASPKRVHVSNKVPCPPSPNVFRKDKPKSESFQKAAAFWNLS